MNFKSRNREELDINITPLIDVVFLLLIFFEQIAQLATTLGFVQA